MDLRSRSAEVKFTFTLSVDAAGIRHFYPQADTLRVHLTLTLFVQCIMHLRSTFNFYQANSYADMLFYML